MVYIGDLAKYYRRGKVSYDIYRGIGGGVVVWM